MRIRKIRATGKSLAITVERSWFEARGLTVGDEVALFYREDEIVVQPLNPLQEARLPITRSEEPPGEVSP